MEKPKLRTVRIVILLLGVGALAVLLLAILLGCLMGFESGSVYYLIAGIMAILAEFADLAIVLAFWRCPSCNRMLPLQNILRLNFCPACGADLEMPVWMI